jgi:hypothetical protein
MVAVILLPVDSCAIGQHLQGNGYARVKTPEGRRLAHRWAWEQAHGPIPEGMHIHHLCGTRACVNVEHMELVSIHEHGRLHPRPRKCDHPERTTLPSGRGYCPVCAKRWKRNGSEQRRVQRRERYENDPAYRARRLEENRRYREARRD